MISSPLLSDFKDSDPPSVRAWHTSYLEPRFLITQNLKESFELDSNRARTAVNPRLFAHDLAIFESWHFNNQIKTPSSRIICENSHHPVHPLLLNIENRPTFRTKIVFMPSLTDKLKSLGVKVAADIPAPKPEEHFDINSVMSGELLPTPLGETFIYEEHFASDYRHGHTPIRIEASLDVMSAWAADARLRELPIELFAFLDTETSGLAGGTGTYAFLVGAARFDESGDFILRQFFMRDPSEEPALLEGLAQFLAPAHALVTFNGKAFDAPLLATRYRMHNMPIPFTDFAHLDLLPLARRLWRDRLESRALKYLEENILLAPRTIEEVPGYEIPYIYFDYLRDGDARPLKGVFYHNAMDVVAMAALLSHTAALLADPFQEAHRTRPGCDRAGQAI